MVLGGMLVGLERQLDPGPVLAGNAYRDSTPTIPLSWPEALTAFERSEFAREVLGEQFARLYAQTRRGEMQDFSSYVSPLEYSWYLTTV
jgi:glutamine synthetase